MSPVSVSARTRVSPTRPGFLEEVAGIPEEESLPRNASFDEGVHNMEILAAVARSAADNGKQVNL